MSEPDSAKFEAVVREVLVSGAHEMCDETVEHLLQAVRMTALEVHAESTSDYLLTELDIWQGMVTAVNESIKDAEPRERKNLLIGIAAAAITRLYWNEVNGK